MDEALPNDQLTAPATEPALTHGSEACDGRAERWALQAEALARSAFLAAPVGIAAMTPRGSLLHVNARFAEILARPAGALVGTTFRSHVHAEDDDSWPAISAVGSSGSSSASEPAGMSELRVVRPDGSVAWIEIRFALASDLADPVVVCAIEDITHDRSTWTSQQRLIDIVESSSDYIAITDRHGDIVWGNQACRALAGIDGFDESGPKTSFFDLLSPMGRERFVGEALPDLWATGMWVGEVEALGADGATLPLSFAATTHWGSDGYPELFSGVGRDITAMKIAEAELARNESQFRTLVQSAPIGIFQAGPAGSCTFVNSAFCEILRIDDPTAALGFGWGRSLHPDEALHVGSLWAVAIRTGGRLSGRFRFLTSLGDTVWAEIEAAPIVGEAGEVAMYLGTVQDVTERTVLERERHEAAELFRAAFDDAPIGIALTDVSAGAPAVMRSNESYASMLGYTAAELAGISVADLTHPDDLAAALDARSRLMSGELDRHHMELRFRHRDGRWIWVSLTRSVVRDSDGRPRFTVAQAMDITAEVDARNAVEHLAQSDPLTGLSNRRAFEDRLAREVRDVADGGRLTVLYLDLDHFKAVNDHLGHHAGDQLLCDVAAELLRTFRSTDCVARLGGDEFAVILPAVDPLQLPFILERLDDRMRFPHDLPDGRRLLVRASVGVAHQEPGESATDLLQRADRAMYHVKRRHHGDEPDRRTPFPLHS